MNPFSRFLNQWSNNRQLDAFIAQWDTLEQTVVRVYRQKMSLTEAERPFAETWPWLRQHYPQWATTLRPYWQQAQAAGAPTQTDPFQLLLDLQSPAAIVDNWRAMQHLPAAREALNQLILASGGDG